MQYLQDLFSTILFRDVVCHAGIRGMDALERVVRYALGEEGHLVTAAGRAFLIYKVPREDAVGKRALKINDKYYVVDQGLRGAVGFSNADAIDQVLEGIVYMELRRRGYDVHVGKVGDREIDFIARRGDETAYYQVSYLIGSQRTADREFGAFDGVRDNWPKYVLSMDEFPRTRDGIRGMNIIDWLLGRGGR